MDEDKKTPAKEKKAAPLFNPAGLKSLGAGVWVYRHEGGKPESPPDAFWARAKRDLGLKEGHCVIFVAGKQARFVVI